MKNKKRLMILGAGKCQVPIISKAKEMGFSVIAVSVDGNYPGFDISDSAVRIDVRKKEEILNIARKENICGILTDQTDIPVTTVAYVAEKMGLPGIGYDCSLLFTDKFMMRQHCEKIGIKMPEHYQSDIVDEALGYAKKIGLPVILKPVDSQGSRGVNKVTDFREFKDKFLDAKSCSNRGYVIIEKFFKGQEIVVEGFASEYNFTNLIIGDSFNFDLQGVFIPRRRVFPTRLSERLKTRILDLNCRLVKGFGLKFGITHSEYLIDEESEEICLMEVAARGGGVFISSDLIPLGSGIDVNELLLRKVTGENVFIDPASIRESGAGYICFYLPEGRITEVHGKDLIIGLPGVHKVFIDDITVGSITTKMKDKTQRLGPILLSGKDNQDIYNTIDQIQKIFTINVTTPDGISGIQW